MKTKISPCLISGAVLQFFVLINFGSATAQTQSFCPDADKLSREAGILEVDCANRQALAAQINLAIAGVNQTLSTPSIPATVAKRYNSEKSSLNSKKRTADRYVTSVCATQVSRRKAAEAARAKCSNVPTPPPTTGPTSPPTTTAYCPLGTYTQTNAAGKVTVCKRGKIFNGGCYYIEEEYHQNQSTFNAALQNPRLAILNSGFSNGQYQINFAYFLAGIPQSACVN